MDTSPYKSSTPPSSSTNLDAVMGTTPSGAKTHSRKRSISVKMGEDTADLQSKHSFQKIKTVILVGGVMQGTPFRPLSFKCPVPLLPIANQPSIMHIMSKAAAVKGMAEILIIGGYQEADFASFIRDAERELGLPVRYLQEYTQLGTAGGMYHFRDLVRRGNPDAVFVVHGNVCSDVDFNELLTFHSCVGDGLHTTMLTVKAREDQAKQYGCVVADKAFSVVHYVEKPSSFVSEHINTGIYVMSTAVFDTIKSIFRSTADGIQERIMFETDVVPRLVNNGHLFAFPSTAFWSQVKTAGSAVYANRHYLEQYARHEPERLARSSEEGFKVVGNVVVDPSASVHPSAKLGPNVSVGPNVKIHAGARVKDTILLDSVEMAEQSCAFNSVIGWNSTLGRWARVEGLPVTADPNDPSTHISQPPIFNTDGKLEPSIAVLGEEVEVGDEILIQHCLVLPHKQLTESRKNEIIL
ncbi:uncharacterized protein MONBRDRAFT_33433 [Monosiga brevicollis MX1]|uniref:Nucleotidyl transferase domain-containing protein n=1 Tax=Monosiga brevicollis TaxID=81824 RepID=A9V5D1_MONBE|nr:uncharacterized protein MONBRDRAFT_33433 [Monosiga brevicollis MX1]EDQ87353.1 predicted protein [Monosiga brevicollis MX1]|eukprot:XP_001747966.1 hypothetical protein [Monosiga brevicollis MX1]